jgi:hypothetical protein
MVKHSILWLFNFAVIEVYNLYAKLLFTYMGRLNVNLGGYFCIIFHDYNGG